MCAVFVSNSVLNVFVVCQLPVEEAADSCCAAGHFAREQCAAKDHCALVNGITHRPSTRQDKCCADGLSSLVSSDCTFQGSVDRSGSADASCVLPSSSCQV